MILYTLGYVLLFSFILYYMNDLDVLIFRVVSTNNKELFFFFSAQHANLCNDMHVSVIFKYIFPFRPFPDENFICTSTVLLF